MPPDFTNQPLTPVLPVKEVTDAIVLPAGLAMKGWRLLPESTFWDLPHDRAFRQRYAWYKRLTLRKAPETIPEAILIHSPWSNNLVHWLIEALPRLLHVPHYESIPTLLPEDYLPFTRDTLHLLGAKEILPLKPRYFYQVKKLYVPMMPMQGSYGSYYPYLRHVVEVIRSTYAAPSKKRRRIYLSRAYATRRKVANEEKLLPTLEKFGFERVFAEKMPFSEQVALFSQAEILLGMHGAGHAHLFWMPVGSLVIEIVSAEHRPWSAIFANLSYIFGQKHAYLVASPTLESRTKIFDQADVILPAEQLESFLQRIL